MIFHFRLSLDGLPVGRFVSDPARSSVRGVYANWVRPTSPSRPAQFTILIQPKPQQTPFHHACVLGAFSFESSGTVLHTLSNWAAACHRSVLLVPKKAPKGKFYLHTFLNTLATGPDGPGETTTMTTAKVEGTEMKQNFSFFFRSQFWGWYWNGPAVAGNLPAHTRPPPVADFSWVRDACKRSGWCKSAIWLWWDFERTQKEREMRAFIMHFGGNGGCLRWPGLWVNQINFDQFWPCFEKIY